MRLFRHLTFSNVIAMLALFIAMGGAAYAGSKVNGKNIVNGSIGDPGRKSRLPGKVTTPTRTGTP